MRTIPFSATRMTSPSVANIELFIVARGSWGAVCEWLAGALRR